MDQKRLLKVSMAFTLTKKVDMTRLVKSDQIRIRNTGQNNADPEHWALAPDLCVMIQKIMQQTFSEGLVPVPVWCFFDFYGFFFYLCSRNLTEF
jgi:hypothetical protein